MSFLSTIRRAGRAATQAVSFMREQTRHVATRPPPAYPYHVALSWPEKAFMAFGSGLMALARPQRGDMVAVFGETTAGPALPQMLDRMLESEEGRRILKERPRLNSNTIDMAVLSRLPEGTFGRAYVTWLERCGVTPDTREPVRYIDDPELAYVMQRYRECHDFYHAINGMPVSVEYEIAVKLFEFANLGLPMTALAGFAAARLSPKKRARLFSEYVPWALRCGSSARSLITVYWEERWEQDMGDLKRELGVWDPPPPRWRKPLVEVKDMSPITA